VILAKSSHNPTVPILKIEVRRCAKLFGVTLATSTMSRPSLMTWLKENPIVNCLDEDFLRKEELKIYDMAKAAHDEASELAAARLRNSNWNSPKPWLRFYLALCEDDAHQALLNKDNCLTRSELDAGDWEDRPETFEEAVARVCNDETRVLVTEALPSLHDMFAEPIELQFSDMPGGKISAEDVKGRLGDARSKLIQASIQLEDTCRFNCSGLLANAQAYPQTHASLLAHRSSAIGNLAEMVSGKGRLQTMTLVTLEKTINSWRKPITELPLSGPPSATETIICTSGIAVTTKESCPTC